MFNRDFEPSDSGVKLTTQSRCICKISREGNMKTWCNCKQQVVESRLIAFVPRNDDYALEHLQIQRERLTTRLKHRETTV